ncbi:MAG: ABC transporter ATP-binding protein [Actinobacteria bacterium]|uniref:Branched-chain amino acid transport ATP-binding protein LivG (TC 3.A.1.4.1) n=1 Tax=hydrothermal vent metagenome TaxID=652676 RepID=A0A3B0SSC0_9ZZZZ|nr:ABC transporter ATP-binding protein [Actinomycetota bacterium]
MSDHLILNGVSKHFGGLKAVDDLTFSVGRGKITGLIGPNGAGKSTVFNLISGIFAPDGGSIKLGDTELVGSTPDHIARAGVGRTFQAPRAFLGMSVLDNVLATADSPGESLWRAIIGGYRDEEAVIEARAMELLDMVGLGGNPHQPSEELSGGELRLLEIARQLVRDPQILLLDEPTAGVSPSLQDRLAEVLLELKASGVTLLVVEHNLGFLLSLAETVLVLDHGTLLAEGSPDKIRSDERVVSAYLGGSSDS